jgi:hypothetical protein
MLRGSKAGGGFAMVPEIRHRCSLAKFASR